MKQKLWAFVFIGVTFLLLVGWLVVSEINKNAYESYLSYVVRNHVTAINQNGLGNLATLEAIVKYEKITKEQTDELIDGFNQIGFHVEEMAILGKGIGRFEQFDDTEILLLTVSYARFVYNFKEKEETKLTSEQIETFQTMKKLMGAYNQIYVKPREFEEGVESDYWVIFLKRYEDVTTVDYRIE